MGETLFDPQSLKFFIRRADAPEGEPWHELTAGTCQLSPFEDEETPTGHRFISHLHFSFSIPPLKHKTAVRLAQMAGVLRRPRSTYRTNTEMINRRRYNGHRRPKR